MSNTNKLAFSNGMRDGIPIALGYFAVAFTLGIAAKNAGFTPLQAMIVSITNNASAGEYAGFTLISAGAGYLELALMMLVANARYLLMSCALSRNWTLRHHYFTGFSSVMMLRMKSLVSALTHRASSIPSTHTEPSLLPFRDGQSELTLAY